MAAQNPPSFMQNVATETAAQARNMVAGLVSSSGIVGAGDMAVSQHLTGNMSVDCAGGAAFIAGTSATLQGMYHVYSDATVTNLVISTADPTNPRIDTVIAQVQDAFYAGAANAWQYAVVTGTPTSGATLVNLNGKGAVPASSIVLAYVLVPATATSIVTADLLDARPKASLLAQPANLKAAMYLNTAQALTSGAGTVVNYDTAIYDPGNNLTLGSGAKFTVPAGGDGYYLVTTAFTCASSTGGGTAVASINKNGVEQIESRTYIDSGSSQFPAASCTTVLKLAAGDTVQGVALQGTGGSLNLLGGGSVWTQLAVHFLSR